MLLVKQHKVHIATSLRVLGYRCRTHAVEKHMEFLYQHAGLLLRLHPRRLPAVNLAHNATGLQLEDV